MKRSQIQFDPEQIEALRKKAAAAGTSISSVVRDAVTQYLRPAEGADRVRRLLNAGDRFAAEHGNVSEDHDRYLTEDFD